MNKSNLTKAGIIAVAVLLTQNLTAGQSKLVQGGATFAAALGGLMLAGKVGA